MFIKRQTTVVGGDMSFLLRKREKKNVQKVRGVVEFDIEYTHLSVKFSIPLFVTGRTSGVLRSSPNLSLSQCSAF